MAQGFGFTGLTVCGLGLRVWMGFGFEVAGLRFGHSVILALAAELQVGRALQRHPQEVRD